MQKTKTLSQLKKTISQSQGEHGTTAYRPKGGDEQDFFDQHKIEVIDDANGNGDEVFKGTGVKVIDRKSERHGYDHEEGKKVYDLRKNAEVAVKEETELQEGEESHAQFQKYHGETAKLLKGIHAGLSKHYSAVTDKKGYNQGQAGWGHVSDIKGIHRQLQDIHDNILQHGEWAKPVQAKTAMREETELDERTLTTGEMNKREDLVKGMKKGLSGFKARYGKDAKSVMYATATKLAKEEVEQIDELSKETLGNYYNAAKADNKQYATSRKSGDEDERKWAKDRFVKRSAGMVDAKKRLNKEESEQFDDVDTSLLEYWLSLDQEEKEMVSEMVEKGLDEELLEFISSDDLGDNNG